MKITSIICVSALLAVASAENSSLCEQHLEYIESNYERGALWAERFKDSMGRFPSGVFSGNRFDFGHFDQCIALEHSSRDFGSIRGQYCVIIFPYQLRESDPRGRFAPQPFRTEVDIGIGTCLSDACTSADIIKYANSTLISTENATLTQFYSPELFCTTKNKKLEFNGLQISAIVIFSTVGLAVLLSTGYEVYLKKTRKALRHPMLASFSAYSNAIALLSMTPGSPNEIVFLHGIRALSMIWIVLVHTYLITYWNMPMLDANYLFEWLERPSTMVVISGQLAVNTFFLLSALLLTLGVFRELDRTKRINLVILYTKRYLRITIPFAAALLFTMAFLQHLSTGPLWNFITTVTVISQCQNYWWTSLLYISNYFNPGQLCFGHSWFLAVDMQLYFLSPIVLYPLWKFRRHWQFGVAAIFLIASVSILYTFAMFLSHDFRVSLLSETASVREKMIYTVTHARLDSWMMGILTGWILHTLDGRTVVFKKRFVVAGWTMSTTTMLLVIFGQYPLQQLDFKNNSILFDAAYDSFKNISWCISIMWQIIACKLGYGKVLEKFLSLPIWLPISRLSFTIYLLHLPIQLVYLSSIRLPQFFTDFRAVYKFFGDFVMSFFAAFLWAILFESPTMNIMKIASNKKKAATFDRQ